MPDNQPVVNEPAVEPSFDANDLTSKEDFNIQEPIDDGAKETPAIDEVAKFQSIADKRLAEKQRIEQELNQVKSQLDQWNALLESNPQLGDVITKVVTGDGEPASTSSENFGEIDPYDAWVPGTKSYELRVKAEQEAIKNAVSGALAPVVQQFQAQEQAQREAVIKAELAQLGLEGERVDDFLQFIQKPRDEYQLADLVKVYNTLNPPESHVETVKSTQSTPMAPGAVGTSGVEAPKSEKDAVWDAILKADQLGKI